jgi:hypothetical protein
MASTCGSAPHALNGHPAPARKLLAARTGLRSSGLSTDSPRSGKNDRPVAKALTGTAGAERGGAGHR